MDPPFLGLLSLAFASAVQLATISFVLGGLFQRQRSSEARILSLEKGEKGDGEGRTDLLVRLGQLERTVDLTTGQLKDSVAGIGREVHGLARQVSALATQRRGVVPPMGDTMSSEDRR